MPIILLDRIDAYYNKHELSLDSLHLLETLGLINIDTSLLGGYAVNTNPDGTITYFDESARVAHLKLDGNGNLSVGCVVLSYIGDVLIDVAAPEKVEGFFDEIALPHLMNPKSPFEAMANTT